MVLAMQTDPQASVSGEIRSIIARRQVRHADLCRKIGQPTQWLSRRLNGNVAMSVADLVAIATALDADPSQVLRDAVPASSTAGAPS